MTVFHCYIIIGSLLTIMSAVLCATFSPNIETGMFAILLVFVFLFWPLAAFIVAVVAVSEVLQ